MPIKEHTAPVRSRADAEVPSPPAQSSPSPSDSRSETNGIPVLRWDGGAENTALALAAGLCCDTSSMTVKSLDRLIQALRQAPMYRLMLADWEDEIRQPVTEDFELADRDFAIGSFGTRLYIAGVCAGALGVKPLALLGDMPMDESVRAMFAYLERGVTA